MGDGLILTRLRAKGFRRADSPFESAARRGDGIVGQGSYDYTVAEIFNGD